ncbi:MAG TPA: TIGR03943 family protein, partial [Acidimicrobiia bacterium]|nr:TIGR03943 family protein [Acidimicrobiia bacterium]
MNEDAQAGIVLALGALALRLGLTDAHLAYIRPAMGPVLALAGAVLVVLGGVVLLRPGRVAQVGATETHGGHDHAGASRVGWLLVAPILAIAVVVPRPLGAFAANRAAATLPPRARADFGPLPPAGVPGGPVDLSLKEFVGRAIYDEGRSVRGAPVRLVGFVTPDARGGGFLLTRFVVTCCAADARPLRVAIRGVAPPW